jgi:hypothetical protein
LSARVSHTPTCRSLIRLKPIVVDAVTVAHPDHARTLDATMALSNPDGVVSANVGIEQAKLAIAGRRDEELARWTEREALYGVRMTDGHGTG